MKHPIIILLSLCISFGTLLAQNEGDVAPDFTLNDTDGNDFNLYDQKGKVVIIFWVGYSCPLCIASAPTVKNELYSPYIGDDRVVRIVVDTWDGSNAQVLNFRNSTEIDALYLVKGRDVASDFNTTYDRLMIIDGESKIAFKGTIKASSQVAGAKDAVDQALNDLTTTSADDILAEEASFLHILPNPILNKASINFRVSKAGQTIVSLYDINGKEIRQLVKGYRSAGDHTIDFHRGSLNAGSYLCTFRSGNDKHSKILVLE